MRISRSVLLSEGNTDDDVHEMDEREDTVDGSRIKLEESDCIHAYTGSIFGLFCSTP
jgi:hypothetical protein